MTSKADLAPEEWTTVIEGPPSAGMLVLTAQSGGSFSEMWAMSKTYAEAHRQHGGTELLDEIVASKPKVDHTHYATPEELREGCLQNVRAAVAVLEAKATAAELEDYRTFVRTLCEKVAEAHREGGQDVSDAERQAMADVASALKMPAEG